MIKSKLECLESALIDADMRYEIAVRKMSEITKRVHELEVQRNQLLRKQFLEIEMGKNPDLIKEYDSIKPVQDSDVIYQEVVIGYRPMSNRKNSLQEERNYYVKEIEKEE